MKQQTVNEFRDGLNLDLHPLVTPKTVLTDNLNGTFITYNGNEFCLQNDRGNKWVTDLTDGYTPIGIKEHNGILYIVSVNGDKTEIGTFPTLGEISVDGMTALTNSNFYDLELTIINEYKALKIGENHSLFTNVELGYDVEHPVTIEVQDSYDGSVNLILVADGIPTKIINSGFSKLSDTTGKWIKRSQTVDTNVYHLDNSDKLNQEINLIRTSNVLTNVDLLGVQSGGQFKGGNYTFYIKFGDADYNQTDVVAESGIVSIFNGNDGVPSTISGTLLDERTDKMIHLAITGLNHVYSKIYIYYSREYSDTQGFRMTEYGMFNEPIDMIDSDESITIGSHIDSATGAIVPDTILGQEIWLTGFEQTVPIESELLNIDYHTIDWARAEAQHSNMLFLGNVGIEQTATKYKELKEIAKEITAEINTEKTISCVDYSYKTGREYYSVENIYRYVGYYPNELYRFGVVFILEDGSKTPVFNIKSNDAALNLAGNESNKFTDLGLILIPNRSVYNVENNETVVKPIGLNFIIPNTIIIPKYVKGWFIVRQKRIPNIVCEGLNIAIDKKSNIPVIYDGENWITQSFIESKRDKTTLLNANSSDTNAESYKDYIKLTYDEPISGTKTLIEELPTSNVWKEADALLCLDPCVKQSIGSMLDGSEFQICKERSVVVDNNDSKILKYKTDGLQNGTSYKSKCIFIPSNTGVKVIGEKEFSNIAGNSEDASKYKYFTYPAGGFEQANNRQTLMNAILNANDANAMETALNNADTLYRTNLNINLIRGLFTPYVGLDIENDQDIHNTLGIYSIKHKSAIDKNDLVVRSQDESEYYCVSNYLSTDIKNETVYRGDCFSNTITMRIIRNFIDSTAPVSDTILDEDGWKKYVVGIGNNSDDPFRVDINDPKLQPFRNGPNLSDVNTVGLGLWVTFKCLSSYNLGLRSVDTFHTDEMALLGSPRSFYPLNGASTATGNKMEESFLLNDGLSATVGRKRYNLLPDVPYSKSEFSNRIMFSNVNVTDAFTNGYRTFQGLSYKDYDKQYGAITKLISLGQNIFVVMEHGLGLVPVNPKALMQTTTGEAIHIYGYGVLPDEMTVISQDYGSKYEHSVIRTPIGIYGIDVDAKKIWRFSDKQGFETISDMKIETYLKDYLEPLIIEMGLKDVRTHYNGKKGDLMFTWNSKNGDKLYSICYNERQNLWTTKYDWKPVVSENINDEFYSLNNNSIWDHAEDVGYDNEPVSQWYGESKNFEFEFVVSDPIGVNKIFDNLQIISNNVQPNELEITIIGDDYMFNRTDITAENVEEIRQEYNHNSQSTSDAHGNKENDRIKTSPYGYYHFDKRLNQSVLIKWQPFKDMYKFGRRIGNIQYKEGLWFVQIEPILDSKHNKEVRIRDKWAKIRIRYSGKDLAIITAIKTLINI